MNLQAPSPFISLVQWLTVLHRWFPLRHALVVGHSHEALAQLNVQPEAITHFKAGTRTPTDHTRPWLIAERSGLVSYYQTSLPAESGLLPVDALKCCWPGIQGVGERQVDALSLDAAAEQTSQTSAPERAPNWLWLGCLPAASLLRGALGVLQEADVVAVRVVLHPQAEPQSSLAAADNALRAQGFALCGVATERNPQLGIALYVKDYPAAHATAHQQCEAMSQAKAELQARLSAEIQAKQVEAAAKAEAQKQRDELAKAKETETAAKQAEAQARAAEQQAKNQALAKAKTLEADKAQLTEAKDRALAQLQQLHQAKEQSQQRRNECEEIIADLQDKLAEKNEIFKHEKAQIITSHDQLKNEKENLEEENKKLSMKNSELQNKYEKLQQEKYETEAENNEFSQRHKLLEEELLKAELQINLIKDLIIKDSIL